MVVQEDLEIEMQAAAVQVLADRGTVSAMAMALLVVRSSSNKGTMVLETATTKAAHQTAESKFQVMISTFKLPTRSSRRNLLLPPVPRAAVWMVFK